jgi:hypothetical protein
MEELVPFEVIKKGMPLFLTYKHWIHSLRLLAGLAGFSFLVWNLLA